MYSRPLDAPTMHSCAFRRSEEEVKLQYLKGILVNTNINN